MKTEYTSFEEIKQDMAIENFYFIHDKAEEFKGQIITLDIYSLGDNHKILSYQPQDDGTFKQVPNI